MKKRGIFGLGKLAYWIIGLFVLVLALFLIFILSGKGQAAIDYIKSLFRFGI